MRRCTEYFYSSSLSPFAPASLQAVAVAVAKKAGLEAEHVGTATWWRGFKNRHPDITTKRPKGLEQWRAKQGEPSVINDFFDLLEKAVEDKNITASTIWNVDEKPFVLDPVSRRVVANKSAYPQQQYRRTHDHLTVNVCVNAAGQMLLPQIIFSRKQLWQDLIQDGPADALYCTQPKGSMDAELFFSWFTKIFLPRTNREENHVSWMKLYTARKSGWSIH